MPDIIRVQYDQNPAVMDAYGGKKPGDKCKFEVMATVLSMDTDGISFTVEAVIPEDYELDEDAENSPGSISVLGNETAQTPASMMVRRKKMKETSGEIPTST